MLVRTADGLYVLACAVAGFHGLPCLVFIILLMMTMMTVMMVKMMVMMVKMIIIQQQ